ncbi:MAG: hypothetical protein COS99_05340 [Candidatus Omnitrophica bacterium CG07_land_8_20_14_0_80_42_15]|uniref:Peptidase n=1 Tax=Candidatus Aquitaenariimonas noxiae TaxID=1974741 RepID=A0A2J0KUJ1_9BACT|nr:MAG: hypothetical protein COS99_05340 [Candidatus Omnitrophica bacterium CG07_land_8_20_14_0_80_42_15]
MDQQKKARLYSNIKVAIGIFELLVLFLFLIIFQFSNASHVTKEYACNIASNQYLYISIYFLIFSVLYYLINFPANYFSGYLLEQKFSLSNQNILGWFKDELKSVILSFCVSLLVVQVLYIFLRVFSGIWWILMALFWVFFTIVLSRIIPTFIIPLFYKYKPLQDNELRKRLIGLAGKANVKVLDTYEIDFSKKTKKANAALVGLGKSRRIILADNLVKDFSHEEIEVVIAHEIGHHKLLHMWKMLFFGGGVAFLIFYIADSVLTNSLHMLGASAIYDIEIFPFFCLILSAFSILLMPIQNEFSRKIERSADGFALKITGNKEGFISLMKKLAEKNLADFKPNKIIEFIFYDHPSISNRIEFAEEFQLEKMERN